MENPLGVALRTVFGPLVKQSTKWPPILAYGLPGIVAVLLIVLLHSTVPSNLVWLVAVVILAPLIGYVISVVDARRKPKAEDVERVQQQVPQGRIDSPVLNQIVGTTIECTGSASGISTDMHLWLAVEVGGNIWPKEGEVRPEQNGRWKAFIFEDGSSKKFSISLLIASPEGDKQIRVWLANGKPSGVYTELKGIPGTTRAARIDGLRLRKSATA